MIYETAEHRAAQEKAANEVAAFHGCTAIHMPTLGSFDALFREDRRIAGACEVKVRDATRYRYPDVWVNVGTVWRIRLAHACRSFDPYVDWLGLIAIQWNDALVAIPIDAVVGYPKALRSLTNPRDEGDLNNPVYLVATRDPRWRLVTL